MATKEIKESRDILIRTNETWIRAHAKVHNLMEQKSQIEVELADAVKNEASARIDRDNARKEHFKTASSKKINPNIVYWDKIKYKPLPNGVGRCTTEDLN